MSTQTLAPKATPVTTRDQPRGTGKEAGPGWLFIAPFAVFFVLFLIWPVIYMLIASMFDTTLVTPGFGNFVGFANYAEMLGRDDFWEALWHTILVLRLRGAGESSGPGSMVLPPRLLRPVHPALRSDRTDLEPHLYPGHRLVELLPDPARRR
jgi:hypothetical protein